MGAFLYHTAGDLVKKKPDGPKDLLDIPEVCIETQDRLGVRIVDQISYLMGGVDGRDRNRDGADPLSPAQASTG